MIEPNRLESHLWEAANILLGPVDTADLKTYIFPLLFFKRISDVYDEEMSEALGESDDDMEFALFAENHRFQIPSNCHWSEVRTRGSITSGRSNAPLLATRTVGHVLASVLH